MSGDLQNFCPASWSILVRCRTPRSKTGLCQELTGLGHFPKALFRSQPSPKIAAQQVLYLKSHRQGEKEGLAILGVPDKSAACLLSSSIRNSLPQSITLPSSHKHQL